MPCCAALHCSRKDTKKERDTGITFHKFPLKQPELLQKWLQNLRRDKYTPSKNAFLCSAHFEPHLFYKGERRRLLPDAVPTKCEGTGKTLIPGSLPTKFMPLRQFAVEPCSRKAPHFVDGRPTYDNPDPVCAGTDSSNSAKKRKASKQCCKPRPYVIVVDADSIDEYSSLRQKMVEEDQEKKSEQSKQASSSSADSVQTRRQREKCCVRSCSSPHFKRLDVKKTFFPFPTDDSRCKEWLKNCGQKDLMGKSSLQLRLKGYKVCSEHFEDSQFLTSAGAGGRKKLVPTAVPTLFRKKLYSRSSGSRPPHQEKSASCGGLLQVQLFSHGQPVAPGNVRHLQMDHPYARQMPEVEIDFAEDPTMHIKAPNTLAADVAPQSPAHVETASAPQCFTAAVDIKEEPVDIKEEPVDAETQFISAKMEPPDDYTECVHSETEPRFNTRTVPLFHCRTEPQCDTRTAPLFHCKTEPEDFMTRPLEIKTEPQDFVRESQDAGPELREIKSEPVYFEEPWTNSEPVDHLAHTTNFRAVLADSECGDRGDFKVELDDTQSDTESAQ